MHRTGSRPSEIKINLIREPAFTPMTPRKRKVCWDFGIPPREQPFTLAEDLPVALKPGAIVLLSGPSGSGKSSILAALAEKVPNAVWVGRSRFPTHRAIVDAIAPGKTLATALEILTACGLGEPRLWIRQFRDLSDGERFRAALAKAVGVSLSGNVARPILCDEFTAILHRRAAKAIAYNLRKLVTRHGLTLVAATTHEDVIPDLQPDQVIHLGGGEPGITSRNPRDRATSLQRRATIEAGSVRDYRQFGPMHYRHRDGLGFVDKVFLLRESPRGEALGILVFAHAPLELALRNRCTQGRFTRNPRRLNRELRILRRLVMHPDVRGCGLGHWFVEKTLPRVGVRFVECLAAMGAVNPVFEKAGMQRIGRCPLPRGRLALLQRLRQWGIDPFADDFSRKIARTPRVRALVERTIEKWVDTTQGAHKYRVHGKPPTVLAATFRQCIGEPPLYYLWDKAGVFPRLEKTAKADDRSDPGAPPGRRSMGEQDPSESARAAARHSPERDTGQTRRNPRADATRSRKGQSSTGRPT